MFAARKNLTHKTLQGVYTRSIACAVLYTKRATHQLGARRSLHEAGRARGGKPCPRPRTRGRGRACKTLRARRHLSSCQEDYAWRNGDCAKIAYGFAAGVPGRAGAGRIDRLATAGRRPGSLRAGIRRQLHATEPPAHPGAGLARTGPVAAAGRQRGHARWLRNESDPAARELFFREADGYRRDLLGRAYFIASAATGNYYFNDDQSLSEAPRYTLSRGAADDGWF